MRNEHIKPRQTPIAIGDPAPDFTLLDQDRNEWKLSEQVQRRDVVLCFYPMDFSPVCETEMKCITDELAKWEQKGTQPVGVSCDSFFTHKAWADSLGLKHKLLADMHREVCKGYGFYFQDLNVAARGTVVLTKSDAGPVVKWVQTREIKDAMDPAEVLAGIG